MLELIDKQPVFAGWNTKLKHQVGVALHKKYISADEVIVSQGSPFGGLYFLVRCGHMCAGIKRPSLDWRLLLFKISEFRGLFPNLIIFLHNKLLIFQYSL